MKNPLIFTLLLSFFPALFSQGLDLSEGARIMQDGSFNSFLFELPNVEKVEAEDDWKKFMGQYKAKIKFDKKTGLWLADDAKMPKLSENTVDVYARIIEDASPKKQTSIVVWFDLGGAYVNSQTHPLEAAYCQGIINEYATQTFRHHAESVTKSEEKRLKELEGELKKLQKDQGDYEKEIEKAKALIIKMEEAIKQNEIDQKTRSADIEVQRQTVSEAQTNEARFK